MSEWQVICEVIVLFQISLLIYGNIKGIASMRVLKDLHFYSIFQIETI